MLTVYLVDSKTRVILPSSQWGSQVLMKLEQMGHTVETTDEDPDQCRRSEEEKQAMMELLDSTGL